MQDVAVVVGLVRVVADVVVGDGRAVRPAHGQTAVAPQADPEVVVARRVLVQIALLEPIVQEVVLGARINGDDLRAETLAQLFRASPVPARSQGNAVNGSPAHRIGEYRRAITEGLIAHCKETSRTPTG